MKKPGMECGRVVCLEDYVETEQCELLLDDLKYVWWRQSQIAYLNPTGTLAEGKSISRTSSTSNETWLSQDSRALLRKLERRLARQFRLVPERFEPWQAARYRRGERFDEHHDAGLFKLSPSGERTHSIVIYLNDHERGGAIAFPELEQSFRPQKGRVLIWRNLLDDGTVDPRMRHSARPAIRTKTILTTWVRQRSCHLQAGEGDDNG